MLYLAILVSLSLLCSPVHGVSKSPNAILPLDFLQVETPVTSLDDQSTQESTTSLEEDDTEDFSDEIGTEDNADNVSAEAEAGDAVGSDENEMTTDVDDAYSIQRFEYEEQREDDYYENFDSVLDPYSAIETADEYVDRIHSQPEYEPSMSVLVTNTENPVLVGDVTDNQGTDGEPLILVEPDPNLDEPNPLNRAFEYVYDESAPTPNYYEGAPDVILAGSFAERSEITGKVWVIPPENPNDAFQLISGLIAPTGLCFDARNNLLYVVAPPKILQFEVDWDGAGKFVLARSMYVEIFQGVWPLDCKIDQFGNMIFIEASNQIFKIDYENLYKGYKNMQYTLYTQDASTPIYFPPTIEVSNSDTAYMINRQQTDVASVVAANLDINVVNELPLTVYSQSDHIGEGAAYSETDRLFYSEDSTNVWYLDPNDPDADHVLKSTSFFIMPKKLCAGGGKVYVADYAEGSIYTLNDNEEVDEDPELFTYLQGAFALYCVNQV